MSLQHRWLLLGTTGCGKTTAGRELMATLLRLWPGIPRYICDSKAVGDFEGWPGIIASGAAPKADKLQRGVQVWQPDSNDQKQYDRWFDAILMRRKPAIVFVDELSSLAKNQKGDSYPINFIRLLKQGRGMYISVIVLSQAVQGMPHEVIDQVTHLLRFRLQSRYGAWAIDTQLFGLPERREPAATYGFSYARMGANPFMIHEYNNIRDMLTAA